MTNTELVDKIIEVALGYNTVYANGMFGFPFSEEAVNRAKSANDKVLAWYTADGKMDFLKQFYGKGYYGFDCVCLIKGLIWGWNGNRDDANGGAKYKSNDMPDKTEKEIIENHSIDEVPKKWSASELVPGEFLYHITDSGNTHCGLYVGNGFAVECTSDLEWGSKVLISAVENIGEKPGYHKRMWNAHCKLPCITYVSETTSGTPIQTDRNSYCTGEKIKIKISGLDSSYQNAWVGLYPSGKGDDFAHLSLGTWENVSEGSSIQLTAQKYDTDKNISYALPDGSYRLVLFKNQGYTKGAEKTIQIKSAKLCEALAANGWIELSIHGYLKEGAWVGIYPKNQQVFDADHPAVAWHYIPADQMNHSSFLNHYFLRTRIPFRQGTPTQYKAVLFADSGYTKASERNIYQIDRYNDNKGTELSAGTSGKKIEITSGAAYPGQNIDIKFYGITNKDAWVGLYPYHKNGDYSTCTTGMWCYTATGAQWGISDSENIIRNGQVRLRANLLDVNTGTKRCLPPGEYQVVLFNTGGYTVYAASEPFTIRAPEIQPAKLSLSAGIYEFQYMGAPCFDSWIGLYRKNTIDYARVVPITWKRVGYPLGGKIALSAILMPGEQCKAVLFVNSNDTKKGGETYKAVASCEFSVPYS